MLILAGLVGGAVAYEPAWALAAATAAVCAPLVLMRPTWSLLGFALSAVASEWAYDAYRVGLLPIPYRAFEVGVWAGIIVVIAATIYATTPHGSPLKGRVRGLTLPLVAFAAATTVSVVLAGLVSGPLQVLRSAPMIPLALSPLAVVVLLHATRRARAGLGLVVGILAFEVAYALLQLPRLRFGNSFGWFTLGSENRWWDSRAVFGTFATTGNHAFADTLVVFGAVILPWAAAKNLRPRIRAALYLLYVVVVVLTALALARAALVSLACAAAITLVTRRNIAATTGVVCAILLVGFLPQTNDALGHVYQRGIADDSAGYRLLIWQQILTHPQLQWVVGSGADSITHVTRDLGIIIPSTGDPALGATADNLYLRTIVESGIFGLGALLFLLGALFRESFAHSNTDDGIVWRRTLRAVIIALAVQSMSSDTIAIPAIAGAFACALGAIGAGLIFDRQAGREGTLLHVGAKRDR
ncbi:MAG: hypothetical protein NVS2B16_18950 [Chloroflexota bacterium]